MGKLTSEQRLREASELGGVPQGDPSLDPSWEQVWGVWGQPGVHVDGAAYVAENRGSVSLWNTWWAAETHPPTHLHELRATAGFEQRNHGPSGVLEEPL